MSKGNPKRTIRFSEFWKPLLLVLLLLLLRWAFVEQLDALAFDWSSRVRGEEPADERIVIVAIDDGSLERIGPWPLGADASGSALQSRTHDTSPTPTTCFGCHADDYNRTMDPRHASAGFPTSCETCHLPTHIVWSQAIFEHDFPIDRGNHSSPMCSDCNLTPKYRIFSCIDCHEHRQSETNEEHLEFPAYSYNS